MQLQAAGRSDGEALAALLGEGFVHEIAETWGANNCLLDSLLQFLIQLGFLPRDIDRKGACKDARRNLQSKEDLFPCSVGGEARFGGFLQHHKHAEHALLFFLERFGSGVAGLPDAGFRLVVHCRFDSAELPPDEVTVCRGRGVRAGVPLACHLFNWMGRGSEGYHYDVLFVGSSKQNAPTPEARGQSLGCRQLLRSQ